VREGWVRGKQNSWELEKAEGKAGGLWSRRGARARERGEGGGVDQSVRGWGLYCVLGVLGVLVSLRDSEGGRRDSDGLGLGIQMG
jgi:hypothetical protein